MARIGYASMGWGSGTDMTVGVVCLVASGSFGFGSLLVSSSFFYNQVLFYACEK